MPIIICFRTYSGLAIEIKAQKPMTPIVKTDKVEVISYEKLKCLPKIEIATINAMLQIAAGKAISMTLCMKRPAGGVQLGSKANRKVGIPTVKALIGVN